MAGVVYQKDGIITTSAEVQKKSITNQQAMVNLSPEDFYNKLWWLWTVYGRGWTSSRLAIIDWLKGEYVGD